MNQERMNAYARPSPDGKGVSIDTGAMIVDLITFFKIGGFAKGDLIGAICDTWDDVQVQVSIPKDQQN